MTLIILRYTYFCTNYFKHCKKISKHIDSIVTIEFIIRTVKRQNKCHIFRNYNKYKSILEKMY